MRTLLVLLSVLVATSLALADSPTPATQPATAPATQPRVFRCVLDGNPRMLVIDFRNGVMAAFDTQKCELVKVWRGDVEFTGTVYDTKHGPQPKSRGETIAVQRHLASMKGEWRGYHFRGSEVVLETLGDDGQLHGAGLQANAQGGILFSLTVPNSPDTFGRESYLIPFDPKQDDQKRP